MERLPKILTPLCKSCLNIFIIFYFKINKSSILFRIKCEIKLRKGFDFSLNN